VIFVQTNAANDNFVNNPSRRQLGSRFEPARTTLRMLVTTTLSLLLLSVLSAILLCGLVLVGLFAAGLAICRLIWRRLPAIAFPVYHVNRRAPG
jgi:hypothetical protein